MPKVSVIIPVYNTEKYLARCIDSVVSQSFDDIEIICINDASTDNSLEVLKMYAKFDNRINIINKQINGGLSVARNIGCSIAKGEYLMFVDSDDLISTNAVEILYNNAVQNNSDVVLFAFVKGSSDILPKSIVGVPECQNLGSFNANTLPANILKLIPLTTWCKFYKTQFLKDNSISFYEGIIYEDVPFWAEVFTRAKSIIYVNEPLYFYRENRDGQITKDCGTKLFDIIKCYELVKNIYKENNYYDKYKCVLQMLMMLDFMSKYYIVKPELKRKLFEAFKSFDVHIDYDYIEQQKLYDFERIIYKRFQKLCNSCFEEFEEYLKGENNANA